MYVNRKEPSSTKWHPWRAPRLETHISSTGENKNLAITEIVLCSSFYIRYCTFPKFSELFVDKVLVWGGGSIQPGANKWDPEIHFGTSHLRLFWRHRKSAAKCLWLRQEARLGQLQRLYQNTQTGLDQMEMSKSWSMPTSLRRAKTRFNIMPRYSSLY